MFPMITGALALIGLAIRDPQTEAHIQHLVIQAFPYSAQAELMKALNGVKQSAGWLGLISIAGGVVAFGGLLVILGVLVALPVVVVVLVPWHWQAAAVWTAAYVAIGLVMVLIGKARLQLRLPPRTIESLKENKEWALRRVRSNGK